MQDNHKAKKYIFEKATAIAVALCVWQIVSMCIHQKILLASPVDVFLALLRIIPEKGFFSTLGYSIGRILLGFMLGTLTGVVLAYLSYSFHLLEILLWPYIAVIRVTPVVSFIILCLVWLSGRNLSIFISFLMVLPVVYINLLNGLKQMNRELSQMARIFCLTGIRRFLCIHIPQLWTYFQSALEIAIGLAFKAGLAAEVIGIPAGSIGRHLYDAKLYLATDELMAWTILIIVCSLICERLIIGIIKYLNQGLEGLIWKL